MGETFKKGQVWENEDGHQIRIIDSRVESQTEVFLTPVKLEIEHITSDSEPPDVDFTDDTSTPPQVPRETLLREFDLVTDE